MRSQKSWASDAWSMLPCGLVLDMCGSDPTLFLPQYHVFPLMWRWAEIVARASHKWAGRPVEVPDPTKYLPKTKMARACFAFPMRRHAGWKAWCAARFTTSGWLPRATAATAIRALWRRCRQVLTSRKGNSTKSPQSLNRNACSLFAGPCPPSQLNVSVNCANDSAMLTWNSSPNAVSYTGKAVSRDGLALTCEAGANLGCQMNGLQCGKEYSFTVSASDGSCQTVDSEPVRKTTGERE